jgi:hypothetical protein
LAAALSERGVRALNLPNSDLEAAVRDLRRSVEFNPHVPRRWRRLIRVLRWRAGEVFKQDRRTAAQLLLEALQVVEDGLDRFPEEEEALEEQMIKLEEDMEVLGLLLYEEGLLKAERKEYEEGLVDLWLVYALAPHLQKVEEDICRVTEMYVHELIPPGQGAKAKEVIERTLQHFPYDQGLRALTRKG